MARPLHLWPTVMRPDIRIRLEGQVEKVEQALWAWECAAKSLESNAWRTGTQFKLLDRIEPEIIRCVAALEAKVPEAPELQPLLRHFEEIRGHVQVQVQAQSRLERLGIRVGSAELPDVLRELAQHHPILHEERLRWDTGPSWPVLLGALALPAVMLGLLAPRLAMVLLPLVALYVLWARFQSIRVVLTPVTLVVGSRAVQVSELLGVTCCMEPMHSGQIHHSVTISERDQAPWTVVTWAVPEVLFARLRNLGVRCEVKQLGER